VIRQSRADTWAICLSIEDGADRFSLAYDVFNEASTAGDLDIADAVGDDAAAEAARLELRTHARLPGRPIRAILAPEYLATFAILARDEFAEVIELTDEAIGISRRAGLSAWETIDQFYRAIALAHLSDLEGGLREAVILAQAPGVCRNEIHAALRRSIAIAEAQGAAGYAARAVALSRAPRFALTAGAM
jgi:hypothetical protein